jgi:addiction module HigA family antidote
MRKFPPVHPGKILYKEFLGDFHVNPHQLAKAIKVSPRRINEIILGKRGISAETALKFSDFFGNRAEFWMELQSRYELKLAKEAQRL